MIIRGMAGIGKEKEVKTLHGIEEITAIEGKEITSPIGIDPKIMGLVSDVAKRAT